MSLDDLLKPINYVDGQVARLYTQLADKLGVAENRMLKYSVAAMCNIFGGDMAHSGYLKLLPSLAL